MKLLKSFNKSLCKGEVYYNPDTFSIKIRGLCKRDASSVDFVAAAGAGHILSYNGSGLPFPNEEIAYDGDINKGTVKVGGGEFTIKLSRMPNAYYIDNGKDIVQPKIELTFRPSGDKMDLVLGASIKNRSLTQIDGRWVRSTNRTRKQAMDSRS